MKAKQEPGVGAPCGLFCGTCREGQGEPEEAGHVCCTRRHCPSKLDGESCEIYQCCVAARGLIDCAACPEFPCAMLLRFSHQPAYPERLPAVLNLQRRQALGREVWLAEERAFWRQERKALQWLRLRRALMQKWQRLAEVRLQILELSIEVERAGTCPEAEPWLQRIRSRV